MSAMGQKVASTALSQRGSSSPDNGHGRGQSARGGVFDSPRTWTWMPATSAGMTGASLLRRYRDPGRKDKAHRALARKTSKRTSH